MPVRRLLLDKFVRNRHAVIDPETESHAVAFEERFDPTCWEKVSTQVSSRHCIAPPIAPPVKKVSTQHAVEMSVDNMSLYRAILKEYRENKRTDLRIPMCRLSDLKVVQACQKSPTVLIGSRRASGIQSLLLLYYSPA